MDYTALNFILYLLQINARREVGFLAVLCSKEEIHQVLLDEFISGLGYSWTLYLQVQALKQLVYEQVLTK